MQGSYNHLLSSYDGSFKRRKSLKQLSSMVEKKRDTVVLMSKNKFKRFQVYLDEEVGMRAKYQNDLNQTHGDEDYDSSEEVIEDGVKKCLKLLNKGLNQVQSQSEKDVSTKNSSISSPKGKESTVTSYIPSQQCSE